MSDVVVRTEGLVKDYGAVRALAGIDLVVERGEVFGFLGPNGAGKSTTIRLLLDLLRPTAGRVEVLGVAPRAGGAALRARLGYLPGELAMAGRQRAGDLLAHLARLRGGAGRERIAPLAARFGLDLERPIGALSKGNKQKVGVVQAFMHEPELLVLDEPSSGLDPLLQRELLDLVAETRQAGATVFMSSHVLSEVEDAADRVAIIRAGELVDVDDIVALRRRAGQRVQVRFAEAVAPEAFAGVTGLAELVVEGAELSCRLHGDPGPLLAALAAQPVSRLVVEDRELEDLFLDHYRLPPTGPQDGDDDR